MDRRRFIKNAASFVSLPLLLNGQAIRVFGANGITGPEQTNGKVLVLIQLDGGNDGLNTLIPLDMYDNLAKVRPQVVIPENKIIGLTELQGLHPSMNKIKTMYEEEKMMFIQNVGYPQPNLSHFRSKEIVLSASDSNTVISSGWFGRYLEVLHPQYPENYPSDTNPHPLAITIGSGSSPTCQGELNTMGLVLKNLNTTYQSGSTETNYPETPYGYELEYITRIMKSTEKYLEVIGETASQSGIVSNLWPDGNSLANKLKIVAQLIAGGLNTPIYIVNLGGFDTHANQVTEGETDMGKHADLIKLVSEAAHAFQDELKLQSLEDNVISLIYSEFGRRIASNKSNGTDHGAAYPMMLFGSQVNPVVFGNNPVIPETVENKTNVPMEVDFRRIYASILHYWFDVEKSALNSILYNDFELIPILKSNVSVDESDEIPELEISGIFPNPVSGRSRIEIYSKGEFLTLSLYTVTGQQKKIILQKELPQGKHEIFFSSSGLSRGHYFLVLSNSKEKVTQSIQIL